MPTTLITGVFDVLHEEHVAFLRKAKGLGGRLIVGIESDARVRRLKGVGRPVNSQKKRQEALERLQIADEVFVLPERFDTPDDHRQLLAQVRPDILAVSSHSPHIDKKSRLMQEIGGKVVIVHQHNPAVSTTKMLDQRSLQKSHRKKSGGGIE